MAEVAHFEFFLEIAVVAFRTLEDALLLVRYLVVVRNARQTVVLVGAIARRTFSVTRTTLVSSAVGAWLTCCHTSLGLRDVQEAGLAAQTVDVLRAVAGRA